MFVYTWHRLLSHDSLFSGVPWGTSRVCVITICTGSEFYPHGASFLQQRITISRILHLDLIPIYINEMHHIYFTKFLRYIIPVKVQIMVETVISPKLIYLGLVHNFMYNRNNRMTNIFAEIEK